MVQIKACLTVFYCLQIVGSKKFNAKAVNDEV